jgi:ribosome recycling factor
MPSRPRTGVQKITDEYINRIDEVYKAKEKEILEF